MTMMYTISSERVAAIGQMVRAERDISDDRIAAYCVADWSEGEEHQQWLDNAPLQQIAAWIVVGYVAD